MPAFIPDATRDQTPANQMSQSASVILGHEGAHAIIGIGSETEVVAGVENPLREAAGEDPRSEYGPENDPVPPEPSPETQNRLNDFIEQWGSEEQASDDDNDDDDGA